MQSEDTWMELHVLHRHGWSIAALAREFGLNWRTAQRYATEPARHRATARGRDRPSCRPPSSPTSSGAWPPAPTCGRPSSCASSARDTGTPARTRASAGGWSSCDRPRRPSPSCASRPDPAIQTQGDWADCGTWPLGDGSAELYAFVAILGCSRMVAVRFATDKTRADHPARDRPLRRRPRRRDGRVPDRPRHRAHERRPAPTARPIFAPEWIDTAALLGTRPAGLPAVPGQDQGQGRAGHPGGQGGLPRLARGPGAPERPTLAWYDAPARRWAIEVVATRRHRTTGRIVGEAGRTSAAARARQPPPARPDGGRGHPRAPAGPGSARGCRCAGETVEVRPLAVYAELAR